MKKGTRANLTGNQLEGVIAAVLTGKKYDFVNRKAFAKFVGGDRAVYTSQYQICDSIYNTPLKCDFILYHPERHENCLVIEAKWQQTSGSVDEKYPYLVHNIKEKYPCPAIILLDGGGYKKGADEWLHAQIDAKLIHVFTMVEFQKWSNSDEL